MKIAFINPPGSRYLFRGTICTYISKARYVWKPKDFILLSSVCPPYWDIVFLDAAIDRINPSDALEWCRKQHADAYVVAMSSISWRNDLLFLKGLNKIRFGKTVDIFVFGEVFFEPALRAEAGKYASAIILDPLRANFPEMVLNGHSPDYPHRVDHKKDVKALSTNPPRHHLFDNTKYRWPFVKHFRFASVYTQFGCPFVCSYCPEAITNVTYRPAENVLEELQEIKSSGYKEIVIGDASFGFPRENAIKLLEGMEREQFGFGWSSYVYPGLADKQTIELMARTGCHTTVIGVDSADGKLLEKYGRKLPEMKIRDFIKNCHNNGIEVCGDIILGFKEDTKESCLNTIQLALDLELDYASINIATPMMGTRIRQEYKEAGRIGANSTGFDTAGFQEVVDLEQLSAKDLVWLRNYAVQRFYLRPSYIWKRIIKCRSFEDFLIKLNEGWGIVMNLFRQKRELFNDYF